MSKLKLIDAKTMEKLLNKSGFERVRQKGSHVAFRHKDGRYTTVPFHSSKDLPRSLIRVILSEINMSIDEYNDLLDKL